MFKRKEKNDDVVDVLIKENKRLKRENANLKELQSDMEKYKDEYTFIITADHGGHDRRHGESIPEDMIIPLILRGPDFAPGELTGANIMDIAPTVANLVGAECAPEWEGKSLI